MSDWESDSETRTSISWNVSASNQISTRDEYTDAESQETVGMDRDFRGRGRRGYGDSRGRGRYNESRDSDGYKESNGRGGYGESHGRSEYNESYNTDGYGESRGRGGYRGRGSYSDYRGRGNSDGYNESSGRGEYSEYRGRGGYGESRGRGEYGESRGRGEYGESRGRGEYGESRGRGEYGESRGRGEYGESRGRGGYGESRGRGEYGESRGRGGYGESRGRGGYEESRGRGGYGESRGRGGYDDSSGQYGYSEYRGRGGFRGRGGYSEYQGQEEYNESRNSDGYNEPKYSEYRGRCGYGEFRGRGGYGEFRGRGGYGESRERDGYGETQEQGGYKESNESIGYSESRGRGANREYGGRGGISESRGRGGYNESRDFEGYNESRDSVGIKRGRGGYSESHHRENSDDEETGDFTRSRSYSRGRGDRGENRNSSSRGRSQQSSSGCFKCGQETHWSRECPQNQSYAPSETDIDDLFERNNSGGSGINFSKYKDIKCIVSPSVGAPAPLSDFESSSLNSLLLSNLFKLGYKDPTPVQRHAIPIVLSGSDLMACAQTGSGKTAAYLLPILHSLLEKDFIDDHVGSKPMCPEAVIVVPTRELAIQIKDEARKFSSSTKLKSVVLYGGASSASQLSTLCRGCNVLVATPGRLLDFLNRGQVDFSNVKYFVLDEADRMLDMGFSDSIESFVHHESMTPKKDRITLMFSATFPSLIQEMAANFMRKYFFLTIGVVGGACSDVQQTFIPVDRLSKLSEFKSLLSNCQNLESEKTLVFVKEKKLADFLASNLCLENFPPTTSIHGDRFQREREEALHDFKSGRKPILVATDVAARGLDIPNVAHVINYDMPNTIDSYVHRIGRTGRMGHLGRATSLFNKEEDASFVDDLLRILGDAQQNVPDWLLSLSLGEGPGYYSVDRTDVRKNNRNDDDDDDWE